jgi:ribosomal protein L19
MNMSKEHKHGIALLVLLLIVSNITMAGWAKSLHAGSGIEPQQQKGLPSAKAVPVPADWIAIEAEAMRYAAEAHISKVTLGHDKKMSEPTDDFHPGDTIFAAVEIAENKKTVKVKGRLHVVAIEGQKAGPIPGIEVIVTVSGEGVANFQFSKPSKGWPLGQYKFEALLMNENGETIDTESHEFTVE